MFISRMTEHLVERPVTETDELNYEVPTYKKKKKKLIYLVMQDRTMYQQNDFNIIEATMLGYTQDSTIQEGYLIDKTFKVVKVIPHRRGYVLYLEAAQNGF